MRALTFVAVLLAASHAGCAAPLRSAELLPPSARSASRTVDLRGKSVSTYILRAASAELGALAVGETIAIVTDGSEALRNEVGAWSRMAGHRLVETEKVDGAQRLYVDKGPPRGPRESFAIMISNPGLEDLLTPLSLSLAAAESGMDVSLIFQGPAVRALKKGFKGSLKGWSRPFSGFARKGMAQMGHVPPQEKLRQLRALGARFYACSGSLEHFGVGREELIFDDVVIGQYLTFLEVFRSADVRFFLQ